MRNDRKFLAGGLLGLLLFGCLTPHDVPAAAESDNASARTDTTEIKTFGYTFIPIVLYSPETGVAAGASVLFMLRGKQPLPSDRPSTLSPTLIFTEKSQAIAILGYELNLKSNRYRAAGAIGYIKFPDLFYGVGPDTSDSNEEKYTPVSAFFSMAAQHVFGWWFRGGLLYEYGRSEIRGKEAGGLLDAGTILGSDGGTVSGLGPVVAWDSRDNLFYARRGSYHTFSATFFDEALGSDFAFQRYVLDLRTYLSFLDKNVLALQAVFSVITGDPPFQMMSQFGGSEFMRGYYQGRYRDRNATIFQAEWRRRIWWRLGAAAFVGAADVAHDVADFRVQDFKAAAGAGARFVIDRGEGIAIRVDFGFIGGTPGPYITINEAF